MSAIRVSASELNTLDSDLISDLEVIAQFYRWFIQNQGYYIICEASGLNRGREPSNVITNLGFLWESEHVTTYSKRSLDYLNSLTYLGFTVAVKSYILGIGKHTSGQLIRTKAVIKTNETDITILGDSVISCSICAVIGH
jgi:hypothetical protein